MKYCPTCKQNKDESEFYKSKQTTSGLKSQCKPCHIEGSIRTRNEDLKRDCNRSYMRKARADNPEKFRKRERIFSSKRPHSKKSEARYQLNLAVKRGDIEKPVICEICSMNKFIHGHHDNYSKPLDVRWLCTECHGLEHRKEKAA